MFRIIVNQVRGLIIASLLMMGKMVIYSNTNT